MSTTPREFIAFPDTASYSAPVGFRRSHGIVHRPGCPKTTGIGGMPVADVADVVLAMAQPATCCRVAAVRAIIADAAEREAAAAAAPTAAERLAAPIAAPAPRVSPLCEHMGCTSHARHVVTVTADGGVILRGVKLCQRHTTALGARGEITGGVR